MNSMRCPFSVALAVTAWAVGPGAFAANSPAVAPIKKPAAPPPIKQPAPVPVLLHKALAGPLQTVEDLVFCTRARYDDGHWYANIGYYCDDEHKKAYAGNGQPDVGRLYKWNLRSGQLTVLLDAQGGSIRDPQVHYDAAKVLFSYRKAGTDFYHLYEINTDGSGLRQLTSGEFDDYEPTYLADRDIAFVSTRCKRWVNCWMTQVGVVHRCDADGRHIRAISPNTEHDNTPWPLPDGRLLYMRWEYVDRSQVEYHGLWTMNPDGTGATVYFGNMNSWIVMLDAKPIPGTRKIIASFSPGHGANEHAGIATIVSPDAGPDDKSLAVALHKGKLVRDPWAFTENCIIAARDNELVLMDGSGAVEVIYRHQGEGGLHEPRPVMPRERERVLQPRAKPAEPTGRMILADVYSSRNLPGVKRGDIKKLLVLESLPKQVNFSGGPDLVSWLGTFTLERVLGTVPVEADGSAYFEIPADRQIFFVALDEHDLSVKRMQSWCSVRPGEVISCVGCHEHRGKTPENAAPGILTALTRPPSRIQRFEGLPDVLDFTRDIQPILDRHCVKCHGYDKHEGQTVLAGDLGPQWSHSFFTMFARKLVADGRNGLGNQPPRTIGSSASKLLKKIDGTHHDVKATAQEWRTLWLWIESGAPYAGSYAGLRNEAQQALAGRAAGPVFGRNHALLQRRCSQCHESDPDGEARPLPLTTEWNRKNAQRLGRPTGAYERVVMENDPIARFSPNILLNFTRPELSPLLLGPLAKSAGGWQSCGLVFTNQTDRDFQQLLAAIREGKSVLDSQPRYGTPEFKPNAQYVRELKRYGILPPAFDLAKDPINVFEADQRYWQSLWYRP
ncbi:MAG: hypothetical protein HZA90_11595 [Verrucomicrobia bacterium]|nr:hypothetical protein [Verrucomicrobiota bacterium]